MISTSNSKLIRSLRQKKFRDQHRLYIVEGEKMIRELIRGHSESGHTVQQLFATGEWFEQNDKVLHQSGITLNNATTAEMKKVSNLVTPQPVLALVTMPDRKPGIEALIKTTVLGFEAIRDPGNLGTIIRTADWFGINHIVCTPDSTDVFNPKVVQATMGAIARITVHYMEMDRLLEKPGMKEKSVYGTFLDGTSLYGISLDKDPLILFGNESHGLSSRFDHYINQRISIPSFSQSGPGSESLNVASSVAVVCSELRRGGSPQGYSK
ncbi:MAG: RNA methyltransferase [Bacteroidales bacterium]|nr:RNA methyltransferase [Bacteroidales bacterium]